MITVLFIFALVTLIILPAFLLGGWVTMLCLGALSHIFSVPSLAIGYWASVLVSMIIWLLFGHHHSSK